MPVSPSLHVAAHMPGLLTLVPAALGVAAVVPGATTMGFMFNQAWLELFGYEADDVQGKDLADLPLWDAADSWARLREQLQDACAGEAGLVREVWMWLAGKRRARLRLSLRLAALDGTQWLLAAFQELPAAVEREIFREMVESSSEGMLLVEQRRIIECNHAAERIYGLSREQLLGIHPAELSPQYQPDGRLSAEAAENYLASALAGTAQRFRWQHRRGDGSLFPAEITLNPAHENLGAALENGRHVALIRDLTSEDQSASALLASEQRFRLLFEMAPVALSLIDGEKILAVNRQWHRLFGFDLNSVPDVDSWCRAVYPDPEYRAKAQRLWEQALMEIAEHQESPFAEMRVRVADGTLLNLLIGGARIGNEILVGHIDISRQRAAQSQLKQLNDELELRVASRTTELSQALDELRHTQRELVHAEKLAGLGALVAGVAHELNTPIGNAVMVASTLSDMNARFRDDVASGLRRSTLERFLAESAEASEVIERNLRRAAELIGSFKQVAVDQSSYQRRPFELGEVLHELRLTLSPTLRQAGVTLEEAIPSGLRMDSFPGPLTQVLMNLVNNAVLHAFDGMPAGRIELSAGAVPDQRVSIQVRDDGLGIAEEDLPRVFDPFFTTRLGRGGSGLGLHIVYSLVTDLLGGRVSIASTSGAGTCVTLELPLNAPLRDQRTESPSPA